MSRVNTSAASRNEALYSPMIVAVGLLGPLPGSVNPLQATCTLGRCQTSMMCRQKCSQTVAQLWQVQFTRHGLLCFRMEDHSSPVQVNRTCPIWATVMIICKSPCRVNCTCQSWAQVLVYHPLSILKHNSPCRVNCTCQSWATVLRVALNSDLVLELF